MSVTASGSTSSARLAAAAGRLWTRVSTWVLAYLPERSTYRRPPVRIETETAVPSAVVRLAVVLIGLFCSSTVIIGTPGWVIMVALLAGLFCLPGSFFCGAVVIALGLLTVFDTTAAEVWRTPLLIAGVPLMVQLAAVAGQATLLARIELRVIGMSLRRYLVLQVFAQLLALVGGMIVGMGMVLPQLMALASVGLLALVVLWLPSLGPPRRED
jgi:hypothetical protein